MDTQTTLQQAADILKPWTRWTKNPQPHMLTVSISRHHLLEAIAALIAAKWGYLSAITGLHQTGTKNGIVEDKQWERTNGDDANIHSYPANTGDNFIVLYQFCLGAGVLSLRIHPPSLEDASVPSICQLIPSATLYERELQEMFGIQVTGTPDNSRLLLPDDWPDGVYPLRKDFTGLEKAAEA